MLALVVGFASAWGCSSPFPSPQSSATLVAPGDFAGSEDPARESFLTGKITTVVILAAHDTDPISTGVAATGLPLVVDSILGQVKGHPIHLDEVLKSPLNWDRDDSTGEKGKETNLEEILRSLHDQDPDVYKAIADDAALAAVRGIVTDKLLISEARATLSPLEEQRLKAHLRTFEEETIGEHGGSTTEADAAIRSAEGMSLAAYILKEERSLLHDRINLRKILPNVNVTWRDIERHYLRNSDQYEASTHVTLARIRVRTEGNESIIEDYARRLRAGEPPAVVAMSGEVVVRVALDTFDVGVGGISDIDAADDIRTALEGLGQGDTTAPIVRGPWTLWFHVASFEHTPDRSLYDPEVQQEIRNTLYDEQRAQAERRYINSIIEEGFYDAIEDIRDRVVKVTMRRFSP